MKELFAKVVASVAATTMKQRILIAGIMAGVMCVASVTTVLVYRNSRQLEVESIIEVSQAPEPVVMVETETETQAEPVVETEVLSVPHLQRVMFLDHQWNGI